MRYDTGVVDRFRPLPLRQWRRYRVLSIRALAADAGVNQATIWRIERGKQRPYPATCQKLAAALDIEPGQIGECVNGYDDGSHDAPPNE